MPMNRRRIYEPPVAKSLNSGGAAGQQTEGSCTPGSVPYHSCVAGPAFLASPCSTGSAADTSACSSGSFHLDPSCNFGGSAATICKSGAHQQ